MITDTLPLTVDGSKNPEQIPDELAWRHFIMAIALPEKAVPMEVTRRDAMLNRIGLSQQDRESIITALAEVGTDLESIDERITPGAPVEWLRFQRESVLDTARNRILNTVTARGAVRLETHIRQYVKPRIQIYGEVTW